MAPTALCHPAIVCAESIAALHFIHPIPIQPFSNPVTDIQRRSEGYTLSFEKERSLCSTLAFLAYAKDNSNNIPAICLEEGTGGAYLNVLLAVNKQEHNSNTHILEGLEPRFKRIFSLLADVDDGSPDVENEVFRAIISMCSDRILYRLGLIQSRGKYSRRSIKEGLQLALGYFRRSATYKKATLDSFIDRAKEVVRLVDSWSKHQRQPELEELVEGIRHLRQVESVYDLINTIPNREMDPSSRAHLIRMISKVARYREAARFLYRMAKKTPLVRKMHLVPVQLPSKAFNRDLGINSKPDLKSTVSLVDEVRNEKDLAQVCHLLNSTKKKANEQFTAQTRRILREAKIHAEIQLLYYCEFYRPPNTHLPRVVCSSKDACWLCNEFILMYEKIHTPRCHGKLYPGWRLPAECEPEYRGLVTRYNSRLQSHIGKGVKVLFERRKRTVYPDPNESTLLSLAWSCSTLRTLASSPSNASRTPNIIDEYLQETVLSSEALVPRSTPANNELDKEIPLEIGETTSNIPPIQKQESSDMSEQPDEISTPKTSSPMESSSTLELGNIRSREINMGQTSSLYKAGPLGVQIEYAETSSPELQGSQLKKLTYSVEILAPEEIKRLREGQENVIVDAESLEGEIEHSTDGDGCVYISNGDTVVKIFMQPTSIE
ncbi:hypothetical protein Daesc_001605 [Daldinia eschscholtzii]|uniref:Uncharacterized protein n=1 Tax=Daldinia eschscholtzii TaxID=292717 RepID=A0AAX6MUM8_9PEZI